MNIQDKVGFNNECIRDKAGLTPIDEMMVEPRLRWFGHVRQRPLKAPLKRLGLMEDNPG